MAAKYGKLTISTSSQEFGDDSPKRQDFLFQAPTTNTGNVFVVFNGDTAVADKGFMIEPGESFSSSELPCGFAQGPFAAIGTASDVLYYTFTKSRG